jgi:hypothetical protein
MKTSDIVAQMAPGLAKTSRFAINISPPQWVFRQPARGGDTNATGYTNLHKILLFCDTVSIPGLNVNTTPIRTFGEVREMPYEFNYEPITATFYVDADMYVKKMFDDWILGIQVDETRSFRYYNDYISPMNIIVYDTKDKKRYAVQLSEVYPKSVGQVQLDYANTQIMKLSVTFQYKYWRTSHEDFAATTKNINKNGGFGLSSIQGFFDYGVNFLTAGYYSSFLGFQNKVNSNLSVFPETMANATGVAPAIPRPWS